MAETAPDIWARWLQSGRHGGDLKRRKEVLAALGPVRDRVLNHADIRPGDVVLDVGTGEGLIGFGALLRVGDSGRVIFNDISADLLTGCERVALDAGVHLRSSFVRASAADLSPIPDESVDVVTTRSVLIYVAEKEKALAEFHRVLRPGGRVSLFEPINGFPFPVTKSLFLGYDVAPVIDLAAKVARAMGSRRAEEQKPMRGFDERDLLRWTHAAGFAEVHMVLQVDLVPPKHGTGQALQAILQFSPNPLVPSVGEAIKDSLSAEETARFMAQLEREVTGGSPAERHALLYLWATKR